MNCRAESESFRLSPTLRSTNIVSHGLHNSLRPLAVLVRIADRVQVLPPRAADGQFPGELCDESLALGRGLAPSVHAGHLDHLLHVNAADQGSAHHRDYLVHVGLHGQAGQQRSQHRLSVHEDTGLRLVAIWHEVDRRPAAQRNDPRRGRSVPAVVPGGSQIREDLVEQVGPRG